MENGSFKVVDASTALSQQVAQNINSATKK
jgi:hypothetical protein